jgi:S-methylmethionine-dependent homocysteine/selenocysteine methylase
MGTQLAARGVPTATPLWSAGALDSHPQVVAAIHRDHAAAGAGVHTANTFRTQARTVGHRWRELTHLAVRIARESVPEDHRVAGSIAPLEDCYRPDLSPPHPEAEHRAMAEVLAEAGCDLLLCETFPHVGEGLAALTAAVDTGIESWISFTAGPSGDLLSVEALAMGAREAVGLGATAVLVNCVPAPMVLAHVQALVGLGVPVGAYANAGHVDEGMGWCSAPEAPERYLAFAASWVQAGATIVGACCGTDVRVTRALALHLGPG